MDVDPIAVLRRALADRGGPQLEPELESEVGKLFASDTRAVPTCLAAAFTSGNLTYVQQEVVSALALDVSLVHLDASDPEGALRVATLATDLARLAGSAELLAKTLARRATCLHALGRDQERLDLAIEEAWAWQLVDDQERRLNSLRAAFALAMQLDDQRVLDLYREALGLAEARGEAAVAEQLRYLGQYLRGVESEEASRMADRGHLEAAWRVLTQEVDEPRALIMFQDVLASDPEDADAQEGVAACYGNMAIDASNQGRYADAIDLNTRAIAQLERIQSPPLTPRRTFLLSTSLNQRGIDHSNLACTGVDTDRHIAAAAQDYRRAVETAPDENIREKPKRNLQRLSETARSLGRQMPGESPAAGWYADPRGRHEYRYWDGTAWTGFVSDGGAQSQDPV